LSFSIAAYVIENVISIISTVGYPGIFLLMLLEGMLLPVPSEVVMAFGGYLTVTGGLQPLLGIPSVVLLLVAGTAGNVVGAYLAYLIGKFGGLRFLLRYGRYLMISTSSISKAEAFFNRYGGRSVFATRLLPVFRTFISIPAGIAEMDIHLFLIFTASGTFFWNIILVYIGITLGKNWRSIIPFFDILTYAALGIIGVLFAVWVYVSVRRKRGETA